MRAQITWSISGPSAGPLTRVYFDFPEELSIDPTEQPLFTTEPWWTTENGYDDTSSILAESNEGCSFDTKLLPDGLILRRETSCQTTDPSSGEIAPDDSGGAAINVHSSVKKYLDLETMELKEICSRSRINAYPIAVCSSSRKG